MELLIKAGYENDKHIKKGFRWLLSIQQDDGGWVIPFRTSGMNLKEAMLDNDPKLPDHPTIFSPGDRYGASRLRSTPGISQS